MKKIAPYRYEMNCILGSDRYKYGDLFGFSYVSDFKIIPEKKLPIVCNYNRPGNIDLFMICDSYLWSFIKSDSIFCNVNKMAYTRWFYDEVIINQKDTAKVNVLIIELTERNLRFLLQDSIEIYSHIFLYNNEHSLQQNPKSTSFWDKIENFLLNSYKKKINQNLEFNLLDYRIFTPLRELKANFNYRIFNRIDKDVSVSTDKKYLFYKETTDTLSISSSFNFVSDEEITKMVYNINRAYKYFKNMGFDEIYFSVIPNPVSIIDSNYGNYNNLIKRFENRTNLIIPMIKVFDIFKSSKKILYNRSDTHWNYDGFQIWVDETNKILNQYSINK